MHTASNTIQNNSRNAFSNNAVKQRREINIILNFELTVGRGDEFEMGMSWLEISKTENSKFYAASKTVFKILINCLILMRVLLFSCNSYHKHLHAWNNFLKGISNVFDGIIWDQLRTNESFISGKQTSFVNRK